MATEPLKLTDDNFDQLALKAERPVLVDFWAAWCGPCLKVGPVLEEIASEQDDFIVAKVNVDDYPALAAKYEVQSIPTMVLLVDGKTTPVRFVGAKSKDQILDDVKPYI
jgi:thioredoxin 1